MGPDDMFPPEMPEPGPPPIDALDDNTVERLVRGRMSPDDAPPGYAGVARVLQAAGGPAGPDDLAGRETAMAIFRAHARPSTTEDRHGGKEPRPGGRARARAGDPARGRGRARVVALALAGVVAAGGLWTAAGAPSLPELPSRAGAPQSGGAGSGASGSAPGSASGSVPGLVNQARPTTPPVTGSEARAPVQASPGERSGGVAAGGASGHGAREHRPGKPPKPAPKPKPEKPKPDPKAKGKDKPKPGASSSRTARR